MRQRVEIDIELRVTPWMAVDKKPEWAITHISAYRIWSAYDGFRWWQCHEWEYKGGNRERWAEKWIPAPWRCWPPNMEEPGEGDEPPPWLVNKRAAG